MPTHQTPFEIVQAQLEAYNARDLVAFLKLFHDEAEVGELGSGSSASKGKQAIEARYAALFANSPNLHSHIVNRTVFGRVVIDLEEIEGRNGSAELYRVLAIYEVEKDLIVRVHFVLPGA